MRHINFMLHSPHHHNFINNKSIGRGGGRRGGHHHHQPPQNYKHGRADFYHTTTTVNGPREYWPEIWEIQLRDPRTVSIANCAQDTVLLGMCVSIAQDTHSMLKRRNIRNTGKSNPAILGHQHHSPAHRKQGGLIIVFIRQRETQPIEGKGAKQSSREKEQSHINYSLNHYRIINWPSDPTNRPAIAARLDTTTNGRRWWAKVSFIGANYCHLHTGEFQGNSANAVWSGYFF